jgi:hypothetical protein
MVVGGSGGDTATVTAQPPSGFTESWQNRAGKVAESAYLATTHTGAQGTTTWSFSAARAVAAWTIALRPAAASG